MHRNLSFMYTQFTIMLPQKIELGTSLNNSHKTCF